MIVRRTVRLKLDIPEAYSARLMDTVSQYTVAFNTVARAGWGLWRINGVELHKRTYHTLRARLALPSQLIITARMKAVEALKATRIRKRTGKNASCPTTTNPAVRFDARCYRLDWATGEVLLTVVGGRLRLRALFSPYSDQFRGLRPCSADLVRKDRKWFLHVALEQEVPEVSPTGRITGVDRGVRRPIVTSDGRFLGAPRWKDVEGKVLSLRRRLQGKGTRSAKRHLKRMAGRLGRFRRDCDHVLSKQLVALCAPGDTLVFDELTGLRSRAKTHGPESRRRLHAWSFARLCRFIGYKAALRGVIVGFVDRRYTSRRCPALGCGSIATKNRRDQAHFHCLRCGFTRNADLVAAWNIRERYQGLWSPASTVPGRVNGPNVGVRHDLAPASPAHHYGAVDTAYYTHPRYPRDGKTGPPN